MPAPVDEKLKMYFLAIVPPPPLYDQALQLKLYVRERYNSKAALNSPPHITLHMPFRWKEEKESKLVSQLLEFGTKQTPFKISLENFSSFPPRVIFIDVARSPELESLQHTLRRFCRTSLNLLNADYKDEPFHPHLTIAFRDLKKSVFPMAWNDFKEKEFKGQFAVDKFVLLKHNGKVWEIFKEIPLQTTPGRSEL